MHIIHIASLKRIFKSDSEFNYSNLTIVQRLVQSFWINNEKEIDKKFAQNEERLFSVAAMKKVCSKFNVNT